MISDSELENIFDDNLRAVPKNNLDRNALIDKTNKNSLVRENNVIPLLEPKLDYSYNLGNNNDSHGFLGENNLSSKKSDENDSLVFKREDLNSAFRKLNLGPKPKEKIPDVKITNKKLNFDKNRKDELKKIINKYTTLDESSTETESDLKNIILGDLKTNEKAKVNSLAEKEVTIIKDKDYSSPSKSILNTIETEFNELKETHKKMLTMRNKILKMLEREIEVTRNEIESEKNKEIKELIDKYERRLEEKELQIAFFKDKQSRDVNDMEKNRRIQDLELENRNLKDENEKLVKRFKIYKVKCRENIIKYKNTLDNLYKSYVDKIRIRYKKRHS